MPKTLSNKIFNYITMTPLNEIKYGLCFFQDDLLLSYVEVLSEKEAYIIINDNPNHRFALFAWMEASKTSKMVWLIDNTVSSERDDTQLLSRIYQEVFSFSKSWKIDNA